MMCALFACRGSHQQQPVLPVRGGPQRATPSSHWAVRANQARVCCQASRIGRDPTGKDFSFLSVESPFSPCWSPFHTHDAFQCFCANRRAPSIPAPLFELDFFERRRERRMYHAIWV